MATTGSDKATLSNQSGNTINLTGSHLSTSANDVTVQVQVQSGGSNATTSKNITVRGPRTLTANGFNDYSDATYGYQSNINYMIKDNFNALLPSAIALNENWKSPVVNDYTGAAWRRQNPGSSTTFDSTFPDIIQGEASSFYPTAISPQNPLTATKVQHWGQEWRIGSTTIGTGARVQTDNIQKYIDHARHEAIVTPAP